MLQVNVRGGTNAGRRTVFPPNKHIWRCEDGHQNPPYAAKCLHVGCRCKRR